MSSDIPENEVEPTIDPEQESADESVSEDTLHPDHDYEEEESSDSDESDDTESDSPKNVSKTRDSRPALTPSDDASGEKPVLDLTKNGIFKDEEMMEKFFPRVRSILRRGTGAVESLTVEEVNELSKFALAKAIYAQDDFNDIKGILDNQLHSPEGKSFGPKLLKPKLSEGKELDLSDITTLGVTIGGGGVITYPMVNSGFRVKLQPIGVDGEIRLEEAVVHRIGEVGRSTIGGGVLAMDAIIIDAVLDRILENVIDHNVEDLDIADKAGLKELISHKDIRPLISTMAGIMHLDGYDYDIPCEECGSLHRMNLNILRAMHYDHGKLTDDQLNQLLRPLKDKIKIKDIRRYQEKFAGHEESKVFTIGKIDYRVHMRSGSADDKMKAYGLIFNMLEAHARQIVGINGTRDSESIDSKSQELLQRMWHLHYLPVVRAIDVILPTGTRTASKPAVILELLKNISIADGEGELATYLTRFAYDNVVTFGTHVPTCVGCGHEVEEIRYFDPVTEFFIRLMSSTLSTSIVQEIMMKS